MSSSLPPKPRSTGTAKMRIAIVAAKFNQEYTDALVNNAVEEISTYAPEARIDLFRVPGAFEIPVVCKAVHKEEKPDCIIALGCIIRGGTGHADLVAGSVTTALQDLAMKTGKPIIHEVLLVEDEKQAYARCIGTTLNRGREAARTALDVIDVLKEIRREKQSMRLHPSNG